MFWLGFFLPHGSIDVSLLITPLCSRLKCWLPDQFPWKLALTKHSKLELDDLLAPAFLLALPTGFCCQLSNKIFTNNWMDCLNMLCRPSWSQEDRCSFITSSLTLLTSGAMSLQLFDGFIKLGSDINVTKKMTSNCDLLTCLLLLSSCQHFEQSLHTCIMCVEHNFAEGVNYHTVLHSQV